MNSPSLSLCSILIICVSSAVWGTPTVSISTCGQLISVARGRPCYVSCSVIGLEDGDHFGITKDSVTYYGWDGPPMERPIDVVYYNSSSGQSPVLPERYNIDPNSEAVNITISELLPEDMGNFTCWVRSDTVYLRTSAALMLQGAQIDQYWARLDESGYPVQRFEHNEEITIDYEELSSLAFRANLLEPVNRLPIFDLICKDESRLDHEYITDVFETVLSTNQGSISALTGLITGFNSSVLYHSLDVEDRVISSLSLTSTVTFNSSIFLPGKMAVYEVTPAALLLNVQAPPRFQSSQCNTTLFTENGGSVVFICGMALNPEPTSFALKIPGREDLIESGDENEQFTFEVKKSENEKTPYLFYLHLTYRNIEDEVFGTNTIFARNAKGESERNFSIRNAGNKPGLPLLLQAISAVIAIASSVSRI